MKIVKKVFCQEMGLSPLYNDYLAYIKQIQRLDSYREIENLLVRLDLKMFEQLQQKA